MEGAFTKFMVLPFEKSNTFAGGPPSGPPFVAQFNPTELTDSYEVNFATDEATKGENGKPAQQEAVKPRNFTFELTLDGSGVTPATGLPLDVPSTPASVVGQIELFKTTTGYNGKIHRNPFLLLVWGPFFVTAVLESYSINYKIFNSVGLPVRAVLSATFREHTDDVLGNLKDNRSSPDVAHAHLAGEADTLPNIVNGVYRDPGRYIEVAGVNKLNTVRALKTGAEIFMPPIGGPDAS